MVIKAPRPLRQVLIAAAALPLAGCLATTAPFMGGVAQGYYQAPVMPQPVYPAAPLQVQIPCDSRTLASDGLANILRGCY